MYQAYFFSPSFQKKKKTRLIAGYQLSYEATHWERGQFIEFIAQLVENRSVGRASHRYFAEVTGSNPVEALIFSGFFFPIA